jgi:hypothetical protein
MGFMFLINGLGNNAIIPIAHKLTRVYNLSYAYVSLPIIITFLVYSLLNFPANHIIDTRGLRLSFQLGSILYMSGLFCFTLINREYIFTVLGSILFSIGQPFIINCPAKIATYWFFDKNVIYILSLETLRYRTHDRLNANRHRLWFHITDINSHRKFFVRCSKRLDILPLHS